ncbi:serine/threonine-protein kinase [Solimicrobium silvestre]|uniref:non-specific serine/threonine protein kinase n=1 Tax=Solimicrobium silvestre TaxID=2099400 RepID=A0A2S9GSY2_9BURK|nr:serine/threonine-protein kinase [Solimicrobium silvestre]PRC90829.1 Protein kinase domain [Solimicrobium silvestre]
MADYIADGIAVTCAYCGGQIVDDVCEDCGKSAKKKPLVTANAGGLDVPDSVAIAETTTGRTRSSTAQFKVNYPTRATGKNTGKSTRRRVGASTHTSTRRAALGGGLISLPDLPSQDPLKLLMIMPEVPANKRHCPKCDIQVNRSKGFCPSCGTPYDFVPHLKAGDIVAGKYEIKGPVAFGGLGWIYLGFDRVLQRWVVLKGLLNASDEASAAAAVAERRYLAAVKHPKIVGIYDFVNEGAEGYIIMEYVGGQTVHSLRKQRGPLPVEEAIAYILGIIPAFSYLHGQGLVYCDFKPDNAMLEGGDIKLIDMGAVRKINDPDGDIYATVGFAAPEADNEPTAVSDLYTLGRALAVLIMDFKFTKEYEHSLPTPDQHDVLAANESLYRFLLRATHSDPDERFQSADEMGEQLFGVLREIVSLQSGPKPADSKVFTGDRLIKGEAQALITAPAPLFLPALRVNLEDRAANEVIRILSLMDAAQQVSELQSLVEKYGDRATEPRLRLVEVLIQSEDVLPQERQTIIEKALAEVEAADAFDWRVGWYRGIWLLMQGNGAQAISQFERCYFEMPGELGPRLAMGIAAEMDGNMELALSYYDRVGQVDPSFVSAHAGAARCHAKAARLNEALAMLQRVPTAHAMRVQAQLAIGELVLTYPDYIDGTTMKQSEAAVQSVLDNGGSAFQIAGRLCALAVHLNQKISWPKNATFLGFEFSENSLRLGAEKQFRLAAKQAESEIDRFYWVSQANSVRPVTLF